MTTYATEIRDAAYDLITGLGRLKTARTVPTFQWQPEDMPACGVYLRRESMEADANAGEPSFIHSVTIGLSINTRSEDAEGLTAATDEHVGPIMAVLLSTPDFLALFEGVESLTRDTTYPGNASTYIAETRLELTVAFRTTWPPVVLDDYLRTVLRTKPQGSDPDAPELRSTIDLAQD